MGDWQPRLGPAQVQLQELVQQVLLGGEAVGIEDGRIEPGVGVFDLPRKGKQWAERDDKSGKDKWT